MENLVRNTALLVLLLASLGATSAAAAKPEGDGPSLATTMQFIQDKMNAQGKVENPDHSGAVTVSAAHANASNCSLSWQEEWEQGAERWTESDEFSFKQVDNLQKLPTQDGFSLKITLVTGANAHYQLLSHNGSSETRDHDGKLPTLTFGEEVLADKVAKAIVHAVELCGGGNKDPF